MIVLLIVVLVGWILVSVSGATGEDGSPVYWLWLIVGTVILCCILAGFAYYLSYLVSSVRVNRRQANFIDAVTHELKSPIASLRLGLETVSRRKLSDEDLHRFAAAMTKDVRRLDRLISHLLDAAGLNVVSAASANETFLVGEVLRDCIGDVCTYHEVSEELIKLEIPEISHHGPLADFEIIFRNLIDNAVKYSGDPPEIRVTVREVVDDRRPDQSMLVAEIENNGKSISPWERDRVFERFERTGSELQRTRRGVGLGLYIVRMLVNRNRGRIRIQDAQSGEGTRIRVEIPLAKCPASESPAENTKESSDVHEISPAPISDTGSVQ